MVPCRNSQRQSEKNQHIPFLTTKPSRSSWKKTILFAENITTKPNTSKTGGREEFRYVKGRDCSFYLGSSDSVWRTDGCLHSQQEALSDAACSAHPILVGCQACFARSPRVSAATDECDWRKSWDYEIHAIRDVSRGSLHAWQHMGLRAQAGSAESLSDKSHGKSDLQT